MSSPSLHPDQRAAVETTADAVMVLAGPGTGKTHTFSHRVAWLLAQGISPESILAVTFTRSAAAEMKERIRKLLTTDPTALDVLWIDTFHAIALRILREQGFPFGDGISFSVADDPTRESLVGYHLTARERHKFLNALHLKKQETAPAFTRDEQRYNDRLLSQNLLDFEDLFLYLERLFVERPAVLEHYRQRFQHILVDEFQDTSHVHYALLRRLASRLYVVGDPDQAIYGFSGRDLKPFEAFANDFPNHERISLKDNFRSKSSIVDAARQVIAQNQTNLPRALEARIAGGLPIEVFPCATERDEAEKVARKIEGLLGGGSFFTIDTNWARKEDETGSYSFRDIAILYRFHVEAKRIQEALGRLGLPFKVYGKTPTIGSDTDGDLKDCQADDQAAPSHMSPEAISLMTLHRAKGLEFPVVFVLGCEAGVLPWTAGDLEEERRLFYVGMTRAKDRLFLSYARSRFLFGKTYAGLSPFVQDIEASLRILQHEPARKKRPTQNSLF